MTSTAVAFLRTGAAAAAVVLAVGSQGDALVVAAALAVAAWRPLAAVAVGAALVAVSWRWGSTSLEAVAGAQAVLGPSGVVGSSTEAAASWLAALAIVLAAVPLPPVGGMGARQARAGAPNLGGRLLAAVAAGAAAAAVVAGPAIERDAWIRGLATLLAIVAALLAGRLRERWATAIDVVAAAAGVAALGLVAVDAPGWSGTVDTTALGTGAAIALAVAVGAAVAVRATAAMGPRRA